MAAHKTSPTKVACDFKAPHLQVLRVELPDSYFQSSPAHFLRAWGSRGRRSRFIEHLDGSPREREVQLPYEVEEPESSSGPNFNVRLTRGIASWQFEDINNRQNGPEDPFDDYFAVRLVGRYVVTYEIEEIVEDNTEVEEGLDHVNVSRETAEEHPDSETSSPKMPNTFGKLYTVPDNARSVAIRAVAKANGLELEVLERTPEKPFPAEYAKLNPLNRVPSFEGSDGYVLTECMAIAVYITSQNEKTTLLGKTKQDYASILRWMSLANCELLGPIANYAWPIMGRTPYNKKNVEDNLASALKVADVFEKHLLINTFLVGERLTLADVFVAGICSRGFQWIFDKAWRQQNPNLTRWYETVTHQPIYSAIVPKPAICDERLKNTPPQQPKKEKAPQQPKKEAAAAKPKAAEPEEDDDEPAPAPKAKHPIEALGKPTLALDDWKRKYSNEETREVALPWFWQELKTDEYSLWRCDYKYNDELTQVFMTSNLIGGFFARLEASRKYIFGCASVFGQSNDSVIRGAFVIRGQDATPAFDVAPDFESYEFAKLDPSSKADREFVNDMWAWDKPIEVNGKTYEWADGKVFK